MRSRHIQGLALVSFVSMISACSGEPLADELDLGTSAEALVWAPQQVLRSDNWTVQDAFGYSIALSATGDRAVIGAPLKYPESYNAGAAYVFARVGDKWTQEQQLGGGGDEAQYGRAVAIDGDTAIVGESMFGMGYARVFVRSGGKWAIQQAFPSPDHPTTDSFGNSLAIKGDVAMIGAVGGDAVYAFSRSGTTWTELQKIVPSDASTTFGLSIAFDGDTLVVGAPYSSVNAEQQGEVYVFTRSGTTWTESQKLVPSDGAAGDLFGWSVALSGDTILVGSPYSDIAAKDSGAVYEFVRTGVTFTEQSKLSDPQAFGLGGVVTLEGDRAFVSGMAPMLGGVIFEFMRSGTSWIENTPLTLPKAQTGSYLGVFAARGDWVLAYGRDELNSGPNPEGVYAYTLKGGDGEACATDAECASGVCTDSACVGNSGAGLGGAGESAAEPGSEGACSLQAAGAPAGPGLTWLAALGLGLRLFRARRRAEIKTERARIA